MRDHASENELVLDVDVGEQHEPVAVADHTLVVHRHHRALAETAADRQGRAALQSGCGSHEPRGRETAIHPG
jgi:hypothetical protein